MNHYSTTNNESTIDQREHRVARQVREARRSKRLAYWYMVATFFFVLIGVLAFMKISSQPTGDELYYTKYCRLVNRINYNNGTEDTKVWECPPVERE